MKPRIHFVVRQDPIIEHGKDELALCGQIIEYASPVLQADDARVVPLTLIADTFGHRMCRACKMIAPANGYIYFMAAPEVVRELKNVHEYSEVG